MSWLLYRIGLAFRETGQALDRVGCVVAGSRAYQEPSEPVSFLQVVGAQTSSWLTHSFVCAAVFRHRSVLPVNYSAPVVQAGGYIAPSASVTGDVTVSSGASVWYGAVVRGGLAVLWLPHTS